MSRWHNRIRVQVGCESGHNEFDENLVYFEFDDMSSNHSAFMLIQYLGKWLEDSVLGYYVISFQCNQMMVRVTHDESRAKIKLAFEKAENPPTYYDYSNDEYDEYDDWPPDA